MFRLFSHTTLEVTVTVRFYNRGSDRGLSDLSDLTIPISTYHARLLLYLNDNAAQFCQMFYLHRTQTIITFKPVPYVELHSLVG